MDRIISKEEEREDPRRDSSIYLRVQWCFHKYYKNYKMSSNTVYPSSVSTRQSRATPTNSTYRINSSSPRNTTTTRLIPCRSVQGIFQQLLPVSPSNSTRQNPAIRLPTAFQGHTVQAGFQ